MERLFSAGQLFLGHEFRCAETSIRQRFNMSSPGCWYHHFTALDQDLKMVVDKDEDEKEK